MAEQFISTMKKLITRLFQQIHINKFVNLKAYSKNFSSQQKLL